MLYYLYLLLSLYPSLSTASYSTITPITEEGGVPIPTTNECYQFTWDGAYDEEADLSRTCDDYFPSDVCFPPLVYTNGTNPMTGPSLGDLNAKCSNITGNCRCTPDTSTTCVKYTKLAKNSARTPIYFSSFCGSGVNNNNFGSWAITSGCHRQTDLVGYDVEVCFCNGHLCNGGKAHRGMEVTSLVVILTVSWSYFMFHL